MELQQLQGFFFSLLTGAVAAFITKLNALIFGDGLGRFFGFESKKSEEDFRFI
jgi:hypothetical protein